VRQACVFGVADQRWGQGVAAALLLDPGGPTATLARLLDHARSELAGFKRPRRVACLETFPLNTSGKVDRARTAEQARALLEDFG
jgi:acyl-CoA synthetase (AMP-forming)/AMP-acid ligase II